MIDFVDASLGAIVNKLKSKGLYNDTLIVVASKHGNAPINPALFGEVNPAQITNATGVPVEWQTVHITLFNSRKAPSLSKVPRLNAQQNEDSISNYRVQWLITTLLV